MGRSTSPSTAPSTSPSAVDVAAVRERLGREPVVDFEVVARDAAGAPAVVRNATLARDGTPMPTRYWLVDPVLARRVARLEAAGGVRAVQAEIDADAIASAHARYAAERDAHVPPGHRGPRPFGGVGGTRVGVKCLHAHYAWHLAGGDDPVGAWVAERLGGDACAVEGVTTVESAAAPGSGEPASG